MSAALLSVLAAAAWVPVLKGYAGLEDYAGMPAEAVAGSLVQQGFTVAEYHRRLAVIQGNPLHQMPGSKPDGYVSPAVLVFHKAEDGRLTAEWGDA